MPCAAFVQASDDLSRITSHGLDRVCKAGWDVQRAARQNHHWFLTIEPWTEGSNLLIAVASHHQNIDCLHEPVIPVVLTARSFHRGKPVDVAVLTCDETVETRRDEHRGLHPSLPCTVKYSATIAGGSTDWLFFSSR